VAVNIPQFLKILWKANFGHKKELLLMNRSIGKFEQANGGTIFLDEIAELDFNLQSKLLRALQEREIVRVGGTQKLNLIFA
jgi:DNA-binding NtrC family response regulator